ncbi:hypothetical protein FRACA_560001 [Frankia canadensis]|uniref:Uncharacterized protein n=1 Tax=Frankia canadensis TaxID=1836972 RepID=A0A2I2KYZ3_9ACTN|nr:hypothetical protein FRACA_560001 [Frankia canadensis]SOU58173.1 hypothetical protein FRACA_560001 [Frankia canadensis]
MAVAGRRAMGRLIGLGFRPEHVRTPDVFGGAGRGSVPAGEHPVG